MCKGFVFSVFMGVCTGTSAYGEATNANMPYRSFTETLDGERIEYGNGYKTLDECQTAIIDFQRRVLTESENYDEGSALMSELLHRANQVNCHAIGRAI